MLVCRSAGFRNAAVRSLKRFEDGHEQTQTDVERSGLDLSEILSAALEFPSRNGRKEYVMRSEPFTFRIQVRFCVITTLTCQVLTLTACRGMTSHFYARSVIKMAIGVFLTTWPALPTLVTLLSTCRYLKGIQLIKTVLWKQKVHHRNNKTLLVLLFPKLDLILNHNVPIITLCVNQAASCPNRTLVVCSGAKRLALEVNY
jgi:hypothetical protein